jgi:hypothetical protein
MGATLGKLLLPIMNSTLTPNVKLYRRRRVYRRRRQPSKMLQRHHPMQTRSQGPIQAS